MIRKFKKIKKFNIYMNRIGEKTDCGSLPLAKAEPLYQLLHLLKIYMKLHALIQVQLVR